MVDLATQDDVESLWRPLTRDEAQGIDGMLRFASGIVRVRVPSVDARITEGTLDRQLVADVVASMVLRAIRNPTGVRTETVGPVSYTVDSNVAAGYLYLDPAELALLVPPASASRALGTMRLHAGLGLPTRRLHARDAELGPERRGQQ
jgi:hypothetical protein